MMIIGIFCSFDHLVISFPVCFNIVQKVVIIRELLQVDQRSKVFCRFANAYGGPWFFLGNSKSFQMKSRTISFVNMVEKLSFVLNIGIESQEIDEQMSRKL